MNAKTLAMVVVGIGALQIPKAGCGGGGQLKVGGTADLSDVKGAQQKMAEIDAKKKKCNELKMKKVAFEEESAIGGAVALAWLKKGGGLMLNVDPKLKLADVKGKQDAVEVPKDDKTDLNRYLNYVGKNLAALSSRPTMNWTFGVLNDEGVNAFSAPGGYVLVTKGLLKLVDNEAQLAGILSHEIAHITERHALKVYSDVKANQCSGAIAGGLIGSAVQFDAAINTPGGTLDLDKMAGDALKDIADKAIEKITESGFAETDEYTADRVALDLSIAAGYNPDEFPKLLGKLPEGGGFFAHHPKNSARQAALKKWVDGIKPSPNAGFSPYVDWPFKAYKPVPNATELKVAKK